MIKLLIKQGPFYISSFTALFLALAQTGWLDRLFPEEMAPIAAIIEPADEPMLGSPFDVFDKLKASPTPKPWYDVKIGDAITLECAYEDGCGYLPATDTEVPDVFLEPMESMVPEEFFEPEESLVPGFHVPVNADPEALFLFQVAFGSILFVGTGLLIGYVLSRIWGRLFG